MGIEIVWAQWGNDDVMVDVTEYIKTLRTATGLKMKVDSSVVPITLKKLPQAHSAPADLTSARNSAQKDTGMTAGTQYDQSRKDHLSEILHNKMVADSSFTPACSDKCGMYIVYKIDNQEKREWWPEGKYVDVELGPTTAFGDPGVSKAAADSATAVAWQFIFVIFLVIGFATPFRYLLPSAGDNSFYLLRTVLGWSFTLMFAVLPFLYPSLAYYLVGVWVTLFVLIFFELIKNGGE